MVMAPDFPHAPPLLFPTTTKQTSLKLNSRLSGATSSNASRRIAFKLSMLTNFHGAIFSSITGYSPFDPYQKVPSDIFSPNTLVTAEQ